MAAMAWARRPPVYERYSEAAAINRCSGEEVTSQTRQRREREQDCLAGTDHLKIEQYFGNAMAVGTARQAVNGDASRKMDDEGDLLRLPLS